MRQDQFERLLDLSERLTDVFIDEADPSNWPGSGWKPIELTKEQRGDRYWSKKNAVATISLVGRIHNLTDSIRKASAGGGTDPASVTDTEEDIDKEIAAAEKEASKILDSVQKAAKKAEFDKRTHGKA